MHIVSEGYPFLLVGIFATVMCYMFISPVAAVVPLLLTLYFAFFFRNPTRPTPEDTSLLYSPADGTVTSITEFHDDEYLNADALKVTIFLSVFNVHVNRSPAAGEIKYQRYTCGHFLPAFDNSAPFENERLAIGMQKNQMKILVIQIAGILARRIVSWVTLGHDLKQGECYGMIKFGSCTELVVPKNVEILCKKGQKVKGGVTVLGRIPQ